MKTQAERTFDDEYRVQRHLLLMCGTGKRKVILWLHQRTEEVIEEVNKEYNSEAYRKKFSTVHKPKEDEFKDAIRNFDRYED